MQIKSNSLIFRGAWVIATATVLGLAIYFVWSFRRPVLVWPQPPGLEKIEPQLRDYITEKMAWVQKRPRQASRVAELGLVYAVNGFWDEARQVFAITRQMDPQEPHAWMYEGVAVQELGQYEAATDLFRELTARFPKFAPGFYRLGSALLRAGNTAEAEPVLQQLTQLAPQEWRGFAGLGEVRLRQGRHAEAADLLEKAVRLDPGAKNAHSLLGQAYRALGRTEEAEIAFQLGRNAINVPMPDDWSKDATRHMRSLQDQIQLANDFTDAGLPQQAVEVLAKAYSYHPENVGLINQLAIALNRAQQPNKASKLLHLALEKDPRHVPSLVTLAFVYLRTGQFQPALRTAEKAIALAPKLAQPHIAKANVLLALERDADAILALQAAQAIDPQNAEIPIELGDVLWRNLQRGQDALRYYETARKLDPVSVTVHTRLAEWHARHGNNAEARKNLERLRKIAPHSPDLKSIERLLNLPNPP